MLLLLTHVSPAGRRPTVGNGSLAAGGEVRVELGLQLGPIEPEGRDRVVQVSTVADIGELARRDEGCGELTSARTRCSSSKCSTD